MSKTSSLLEGRTVIAYLNSESGIALDIWMDPLSEGHLKDSGFDMGFMATYVGEATRLIQSQMTDLSVIGYKIPKSKNSPGQNISMYKGKIVTAIAFRVGDKEIPSEYLKRGVDFIEQRLKMGNFKTTRKKVIEGLQSEEQMKELFDKETRERIYGNGEVTRKRKTLGKEIGKVMVELNKEEREEYERKKGKTDYHGPNLLFVPEDLDFPERFEMNKRINDMYVGTKTAIIESYKGITGKNDFKSEEMTIVAKDKKGRVREIGMSLSE